MNRTTFGLGKLVLSSNDPEAVSAFYTRAGGMSFDRVEGTRRYESVCPDGTILVIDAAPDPLPQGRRECALSLRVPDLAATTKRLREEGVEVGGIVEQAGGKLAVLKDPDGREVELWEPRSAMVVEAPPIAEKPAMIEEKPAAVAPPPLVEKAAAVEPPPLIDKPAAVEPPPLIDKPAAVEPPPLVDKPAAVEPPPLVDKPAAVEGVGEVKATDVEVPKATDVEVPKAPLPPPMMGTPGPILSALRPGVVSSRGGMKISLYGANFTEGCRVLVGDDDMTSPRTIDDSMLEITAPARPPGPVDIIVESLDGKRASLQIIYDEGPTIERFSPLEGPPGGGTEIIVEGRNFQEGCRLTFFGDRAPEVVLLSPERIRFTTLAQDKLFKGEVRVTNLDGLSAVAPDLFMYRLPTPEIRSASPAAGLIAGGKRVVVKGIDFHSECTARLGESAATVTWKSPELLELVTPPAAEPGAVDLEIENPDGQIAKLEGAFTYEAEPTPPLLVEVQPATGYCEGGQIIRLFGNNFEVDTIVRIGEVRAIARLISHREIEIELPPRREGGLVAVELTDRHGVVVRREDGFTYELRPAPRIDGVTPRSGPMVGGTKLIIEGDYFDDRVYVRIGRQAPKYVVVRSKTTIEVGSPPSREAGLVDVEVGRGEAGLTVAKSAFRYDPSPAPVIESVAPTKGSVDGGTEVSIEGKGFVADSIVLFGRTRAPSIKFVSGSTIEVKAPPGKNGEMMDITVRNPDGKEAVSKRAFMYDARYR